MAVKSNRINTSVSFAFANIAENNLNVKSGDLLSFTEEGFVTKATPETVVMGIANDKAVFPENNETVEQWRVDYNPVIWENTYKMAVAGGDTSSLIVGHFYTMNENQELDPSTDSPSVGQFMVQDIYANAADVRFVTNLGLAIDQYKDVRLESIAPKNPESTPFDGIYNFTLSNGTVIEGDFSDLCRWTTDIEFGGDVTVDGNLQVTGETTLGNTTTNDLTANDIQANSITADLTAENAEIGEATIESATITDLNVENMSYTESVHFEHDVDIDEDLNVDGNVHVGNCETVDHILTVNEQLLLGPNATAPQFVLQAEKNQPNGVAGLDSNGLLSNSVLPPLAIGETYICADEAEQLALEAQRGDFCVRTDLNKTFIKLNDTNPATMADWQEIVAELPETGYREEYTETGSGTYALEHTPVSPTSFMVYTDSGTVLFPTVDYTYDNNTRTITFLSLNNNETVHIWNLSYGTQTPPTPPTPAQALKARAIVDSGTIRLRFYDESDLPFLAFQYGTTPEEGLTVVGKGSFPGESIETSPLTSDWNSTQLNPLMTSFDTDESYGGHPAVWTNLGLDQIASEASAEGDISDDLKNVLFDYIDNPSGGTTAIDTLIWNTGLSDTLIQWNLQ